MPTCFKCGQKVSVASNPYGLHDDCFHKWFNVTANSTFNEVARRQIVSQEPLYSKNTKEYWNSSFFHGKFRKYSGKLNSDDYILKVEEDIAPELPNVEYLSNQIADLLNINIPDFYLINFYKKRCFVTKNFISKSKEMKTLIHMYHYVDTSENYNCEYLLEIIQKETQNYVDMINFINGCLFDALIGNHDRHGRNLGFIKSSKRTILAPLYDNTSALGLESGEILQATFEPRGKIATSKTYEPTAYDYAIEFQQLGFGNVVKLFIDKIDINAIEKLVENSFCSKMMKSALKKLTHNRYEEYLRALRNKS